MFTLKDIENKTIFVINGKEHQHLHVKSGFMHLLDKETGKTITKFPFPKILFLIVIGHTSITTSLIEKCNKYKIPMVVMKPNFRPVFYYGNFAEANYLLREKQYSQPNTRIDIARHIVENKLMNQRALLKITLKNNEQFLKASQSIVEAVNSCSKISTMKSLMALEGRIAKQFFKAYFAKYDWLGRKPRIKIDPLNCCLDIGYTFLFNFIENMCRLFGFDLYKGVYHQLWFKRKSLVCDLIEPFRCIVEHRIYINFRNGKFSNSDFIEINKSYYIEHGKKTKYTEELYDAIIPYKMDIFKYVQKYYRCFMADKEIDEFPVFLF